MNKNKELTAGVCYIENEKIVTFFDFFMNGETSPICACEIKTGRFVARFKSLTGAESVAVQKYFNLLAQG